MIFDTNFTLLLMVFMRMSGCILFNPILGRRNIPIIFKIGLTMALSLFAFQMVSSQSFEIHSFLVFVVSAVRELAIGFVIGFVIQLFVSVIIMGGEMADLQVGISMSKVYDPQSNVSMPLSASIINAMFILLFFVTNSHLTLLRIFSRLCIVVPYGENVVQSSIFENIVALLGLMLVYAVKLALPIIAIQLLTEIGVGLVMRAVPQIDVFAVQIQMKLLIGFVSMLVLVPSYSSFLERLIDLMFDNISHIFAMLTASG